MTMVARQTLTHRSLIKTLGVISSQSSEDVLRYCAYSASKGDGAYPIEGMKDHVMSQPCEEKEHMKNVGIQPSVYSSALRSITTFF